MAVLTTGSARIELRNIVTLAKRSNSGWPNVASKRNTFAVRLKRFLALLKSHGRQLAELVGEDDEDLGVCATGEEVELEAYDSEPTLPDSRDDESKSIGNDVEAAHEEWDDELDEEAVENSSLLLPSQFSAEEREEITALKSMAEREKQIRRAYLDMRKRDLNLSLRVFGVMLRDAKKHGTTTRAKATIERQKQIQMKAVKSYQQHQAALVSLGMSADDESRYPPLTWQQLLRHRPFRNKTRELGEGRYDVRGPLLPWLMMDLSDTVTAEDSEQAKESLIRSLSTDGKRLYPARYFSDHFKDARVRFFRIEAEAMRWREQLALIGAEFGRTVRHFRRLSGVWLSAAHSLQKPSYSESPIQERSRLGRHAYALKKSAFFESQARFAAEKRQQSGMKNSALEMWNKVDQGM